MLNTKRILFSCANKSKLINFWKGLNINGFEAFASDGTYNHLYKSGITDNLKHSNDITNYSNILNGKVKMIHPDIFTSILADPDLPSERSELMKQNLKPISIVCVNLYNIERELEKYYSKDTNYKSIYYDPTISNNPILSNIDIGGSALIRSACKNYKNVLPVVDTEDYTDILEIISNNGFFELSYKKKLAAKAFDYITTNDMMISEYFNEGKIKYKKKIHQVRLKYGCNPNQKIAGILNVSDDLPFKILNGKPSYINILDSLYSWNCVSNISNNIRQLDLNLIRPIVAASYKHNSPAGIAMDFSKKMAYDVLYNARNSDSLSSFGDFIAINTKITKTMAEYISKNVSDGIIAEDYDDEALEILKKKKKGNYLILKGLNKKFKNKIEYRELYGVTLYQERNSSFQNIIRKIYNYKDMELLPTSYTTDAIIGTIALNYIPSNAITFIYNGTIVGIGSGQQNRVDCIEIAGKKAMKWWDKFHTNTGKSPNFVMSSDGFLPFEDNIATANKYNVKLIIQPGGSINDKKIRDKCKKYDIYMIHTGQRLFTH